MTRNPPRRDSRAQPGAGSNSSGPAALPLATRGIGSSRADRLRRGISALESGKPDLAMHHAEILLRCRPGNESAWHLMGRALLAMGEADRAVAALLRAIDAGAAFDTVIVDLGDALLMQGRYREVPDAIDPVYARDDATRRNIIVQHGRAALAVGERSKAQAIFALVLGEDGGHPAALAAMAEACGHPKAGLRATSFGGSRPANSRSAGAEDLAAETAGNEEDCEAGSAMPGRRREPGTQVAAGGPVSSL